MKFLLFLSCGRCGTVRLAQLLREKLPEGEYAVVHQMKYSRIANVVGNIIYRSNRFDCIKEKLYLSTISKYRKGRHFVCLDPLTAMIIPKKIVEKPDTHLIHIQRDHDSFARSMVNLSRKRLKSLIAHNLIPFWQPRLLPLENYCRRIPHKRYIEISILKNQYFINKYAKLKNYHHIDMNDIFKLNQLSELISITIGESIDITKADLSRKANES